jgi:hypothetical protein
VINWKLPSRSRVPKLGMADLIHTVGAPRRLAKKTSGGIVMIKTTSVAFTREPHCLASADALVTFFPANGDATSIPSQTGSSLESALLPVVVSIFGQS